MKSQEEIDREWAELETEKEQEKEDSERFDLDENRIVIICAGVGFVIGVLVGAFVLEESHYAMWVGAIAGGCVGKLIDKKRRKNRK